MTNYFSKRSLIVLCTLISASWLFALSGCSKKNDPVNELAVKKPNNESSGTNAVWDCTPDFLMSYSAITESTFGSSDVVFDIYADVSGAKVYMGSTVLSDFKDGSQHIKKIFQADVIDDDPDANCFEMLLKTAVLYYLVPKNVDNSYHTKYLTLKYTSPTHGRANVEFVYNFNTYQETFIIGEKGANVEIRIGSFFSIL